MILTYFLLLVAQPPPFPFFVLAILFKLDIRFLFKNGFFDKKGVGFDIYSNALWQVPFFFFSGSFFLFENSVFIQKVTF